jgi:DNA-binding IclR family transcriptional regulator
MKRGSPTDREPAAVNGRPTSNRSVDRACAVMAAFSLEEPTFTLAELARRVELPKATVYRLVSSLVARGFMVHAPDGRYSLGVKLMECGAVVRENLDIVKQCSATIDEIATATSETVLLAAVDWPARELVVVARRDSPHILSVASPVGRRLKLPPGGALARALLSGLAPREAESIVGRLRLTASTPKTHVDKQVLLRDLEVARELGYAAEQDEYIDGVSGVAVPVIFEAGRPLAAVGVIGPSSRIAGELAQIGALLRKRTVSLRPADGPVPTDGPVPADGRLPAGGPVPPDGRLPGGGRAQRARA